MHAMNYTLLCSFCIFAALLILPLVLQTSTSFTTALLSSYSHHSMSTIQWYSMPHMLHLYLTMLSITPTVYSSSVASGMVIVTLPFMNHRHFSYSFSQVGITNSSVVSLVAIEFGTGKWRCRLHTSHQRVYASVYGWVKVSLDLVLPNKIYFCDFAAIM